MADWRQIHARIRKAKASSDPLGQLENLYQRTRDAMVAFELAAFREKSGAAEECIRWYTIAAEHFRRAQWRAKAEEALVRLGAQIPIYAQPVVAEAKSAETAPAQESQVIPAVQQMAEAVSEPVEAPTEAGEKPAGESASPAVGAGTAVKKRRRRGRRGGRSRRKSGAPGHSAVPPTAAVFAESQHVEPVVSVAPWPKPAPPAAAAEPEVQTATTVSRERVYEPISAPSWQGYTRAGEPALASRIAQLESHLRRLLACPLASLEDADRAPAGPGVLLLSDSDQVTHYFVESCQTLRIGIGNLLRGGRGSKEGTHLKERMAENLGIAEGRVSKYLKDHCAVRWIQLDEGAPEMAHFAIAVLRPVANE